MIGSVTLEFIKILWLIYSGDGARFLKGLAMAGEDLIEVKFRLFDGTDIGPSKYDPTTTVASLKETILARWPQGERVFPPRLIPSVVQIDEFSNLLPLLIVGGNLICAIIPWILDV